MVLIGNGPRLERQESEDIFHDAHSTIKRPSISKEFSSAWTISIPLKPIYYEWMSESRVLVAHQNKCVQCKRPLKWKTYRAVLTESDHLKLYPICHLFTCFPLDKKARFSIDLTQSRFVLSLMSPVDFSWSLESKDDVFYFTTNHIKKSQRWYQSIYQALPAQAKKPLPKSIELNIPELDMTIQLPLHELVAENNVALKSIRDSALALLHRYGYRPSDWNKQSVGLCWYYPPLQHLDWAIVPYHDQGDLIQPRLIEGIHRLELRHWHKRQEPRPDTPILIEGYLTHRHKRVMYAKNMDHYLLLYKITNSLCKTKKTSPLDNTTAGIVGMVDLTKMRRNQLWIDFDQHQYTFEPITLIESLYVPASYSKVVKSDVLYMKSNMSRLHTFQQKQCILTACGHLLVFKKNMLVSRIALRKQHCFVYSGEACCAYIHSLPTDLPSRLFEAGTIVEQEEPRRCCFVVLYKKKPFIFLTRTCLQKEAWVHSIYSTMAR